MEKFKLTRYIYNEKYRLEITAKSTLYIVYKEKENRELKSALLKKGDMWQENENELIGAYLEKEQADMAIKEYDAMEKY